MQRIASTIKHNHVVFTSSGAGAACVGCTVIGAAGKLGGAVVAVEVAVAVAVEVDVVVATAKGSVAVADEADAAEAAADAAAASRDADEAEPLNVTALPSSIMESLLRLLEEYAPVIRTSSRACMNYKIEKQSEILAASRDETQRYTTQSH